MSDNNIFNQNQNPLINTNQVMDYEPNANQSNSRVIVGLEKRLMAFDIDPGILQTGLYDYLNQNSLRFSKSIGENAIIKEIIKKIEELSNNLVKVVNDIKEKFNTIEDALSLYSQYNEKNINDKINALNEVINKFKKEQAEFITNFSTDLVKNINLFNEDIKNLKAKQKENENKFKNIDHVMKEKIDSFLKERMENMIKNNEIKIDIVNNGNKKEFDDIKIDKYASNSNNKNLKFKIFQKNNSIIFKDITTDCETEEKEKILADKFKIIFKKDEKTEKGITYEISTLSKDWDFSRHMKNILKRLYRSRYNRRINTYNLNHVFRMKWSKNQIQFEKIQATTRYINNNNFFVKVGNNMVFVKNKGRFKRNLNFFKKFKNLNKFKNYNNKNNNQNLLGNLPNQNNNNRKFNNNRNNGKNQKNVNNNRIFNKRRIRNGFKKRFNNNRFYNRQRYFNNQRIVLVPRMVNYGPRDQNF